MGARVKRKLRNATREKVARQTGIGACAGGHGVDIFHASD